MVLSGGRASGTVQTGYTLRVWVMGFVREPRQRNCSNRVYTEGLGNGFCQGAALTRLFIRICIESLGNVNITRLLYTHKRKPLMMRW